MYEAWLDLLAKVLRPARPRLEECMRARELHVAARRRCAEERTRALSECEARIETARAAIFASNDGVVTRRMTELEREWRALARLDPDAGLMDLWTTITPVTWTDRKRWRDADPGARVDAAVALASDVDGVEAAEAAVESYGLSVRWCPLAAEADITTTTELLAAGLLTACDALSSHDGSAFALARAREVEQRIHEAAARALPSRPLFARGIAHAAFVDCVWTTASLPLAANPTAPLQTLWRTGYAIAAFDTKTLTLAIPTLPAPAP